MTLINADTHLTNLRSSASSAVNIFCDEVTRSYAEDYKCRIFTNGSIAYVISISLNKQSNATKIPVNPSAHSKYFISNIGSPARK